MSEAQDLKRYMDAVKGRPLSWGLAIDMQRLLGRQYSGGDKLSPADRTKLQGIVDTMLLGGVKPAKSLLSREQKKALMRHKG
jgi:hypothetical protein